MRIRVTKSDGAYTAVIPELHIVDQADTLEGLKESLKEAVELYVEYALEEGSKEDKEGLYRLLSREIAKKDRDIITRVVSSAFVKRVMAGKIAQPA